MRKLLVSLTLLIAFPLGAAYDFSGGGSDDAIKTNLTAHNTLRSYGLWTYREGDGEGGTGRMFDKRDSDTQVEFFAIFGSANVYSYRREFSGSSTDWKIDKPSLNAWHHILIVYDSSDVANDAIIYVDGVSQTVTETGAPSGTASTNTSAYLLGNRNHPTSGFNRTWDGRLCEWAVWNRLLTADEADIIGAKKFSPLFVPDGLIRYSLLVRELNDRLDSGSQTTNDTPTVIEHPPIIYPTQPISGFAAAAAPPAGKRRFGVIAELLKYAPAPILAGGLGLAWAINRRNKLMRDSRRN